MNLGDKILKTLFEPKLRYKGIQVNMLGIPSFETYKKQSVKNSFSDLRNKKYIVFRGKKIIISENGIKHLKQKSELMKNFSCPFPKDAPKNLIVMYDIPQDKKPKRDWFRFHLRKFGYEMIQKSVWVGPSPLPKEFISYVKQIHLNETIKTFKLAKNYDPNRNKLL